MLLVIDIGNTNINLGLFKGSRLIKRYIISTKLKNYLPALKEVFAKNNINAAIICSVVARVTFALENNLKKLLGKRPYIIGKDIKVPIKNLYRHPKQVGFDRLVNGYAGFRLYGAPLIIVDFGTAITFDVILKNKAYLGGLILPGLEISLDALANNTALLPRIKLTQPKEFIGRDTKNSMLSGIVYGFSSLTDTLVKKIKNRLGRGTKVIGTGGNINLMSRYCREFDKIDRDLIFKGLKLIYNINKKESAEK